MTINIQREALNCITNGAPLALHQTQHSVSDSYLRPGNPSQDSIELQPLDKRLVVATVDVTEESSYPELDLTDDDSSVSSYSISSSSRRVSFREDLVTDVWVRPRTLQRHIRKLFYSYEETQKFRQEYRLERKRAAEEAEISSQSPPSDLTVSSDFPMWRHKISRVVIKRGDVLETFVDRDLDRDFDLGLSSNSCATNGSNASSESGTTKHSATGNCKMANDDFFDNDNFWSGQITWY